MGIKTGYNSALGMPRFGAAYDDAQGIAPGTRAQGFDDTNDIVNEYIWLKGPNGAVAVGDDVTFNASYVATAAAAGAGQADAIAVATANQYAWYQLKAEQAAGA